MSATAVFIVLMQILPHGPVIRDYVGTVRSVEDCERGAQVLNSSPDLMNREMIEQGIGFACVIPTQPIPIDEQKFKEEAERQLRNALGIKES